MYRGALAWLPNLSALSNTYVCATEEARKRENEREREKRRDERGKEGKGARERSERVKPKHAR